MSQVKFDFCELVKGVSRIIERVSSRNEYIDPADLNDLLEQIINWGLFQLTGAMPLNTTIVKDSLPEEVIPKDDSQTETKRAKRKKPMTRRRFQPTSDSGRFSIVILSIKSDESQKDIKLSVAPTRFDLKSHENVLRIVEILSAILYLFETL